MSLSNSQHKTILNQLEEIRTKNMLLHENRLSEVYKAHPDIKAIQDEIVNLNVSMAKQNLKKDFSEGESDLSEMNLNYKKTLNSLSNKKSFLLVSYGYPKDYLDPIYDCPYCNDTGYIEDKPCTCYEKRAVSMLYDSSNLAKVLERENFDTFNFNLYDDSKIYDDNIKRTPRENIRRIYNISKDFIKNFDNEFENFLFYGMTGVGKTFLTHCIAKELIKTSHTVIYVSSIELFNKLGDYRFHSKAESNDYNYFINCDLLIIDDLGSEMVNTFTDSELYNIINLRILHSRSTIISTNNTFENLKNMYSERVFSRLIGNYTFCRIVGEDLRIALKSG